MNYKDEYDKIIQYRKLNKLEKTTELYTEEHHITPKSFFSKNDSLEIINHSDNLVRLTGKEHFLAHYYLYNSLEKGSGLRKIALMCFKAMSFDAESYDGNRYYNAELYQKAREEYYEILEAEGKETIIKICNFKDEFGYFPKQRSNDDYEALLGKQLQNKRNCFKNQEDKLWFESYSILAIKLGHVGIFERRDLEQEGLDRINYILDWIDSNNKIPSFISEGEEKEVARKINNFRKSKSGRTTYYSSYQKLIEEKGYPDLFDVADVEQRGIDKINDIINFIEKYNRLPKIKTEKSLTNKMYDFRKAKMGNGRGKWYDSYQELITSRGYPKLFDRN